MAQREPSLQEVLESNFDYMTSNMYTAITGIIVSVEDAGENRVVVQPSINMVTRDMLEITERSPILNVPLVQHQSKEGGLSIPVKAGDPVFLIFSMRGLDAWKQGNGYPTTPTDRRKFDNRDCIAIPGVFPFGQSPNRPSAHTLAHSPDDVVLVHNLGKNNEAEFRIKAGTGKIEINAPNSDVEVVCKNSTVSAQNKVSYQAQDFEITCINYKLTTGNYQVDVDSGGSNVSTGVFRMNGQFLLNNIHIESHRHTETGSITNGPIN
jgi:hypothetical protein